MAWFCAQCGSPNDPQMPRCRVCGGQPIPGQAPGGYGHQQQAMQAGFGQAPGYTQPQAPVGYGAPAGYAPPGGYGAMPMPPAAAKRDDSGFKIGCALAGCLGAGLVIASVLGVILIYGSRGSEPGPDDERPTSGDGDERREAPKSGSLRDNIPQRVGSYTVSSSRPLQVPRSVDAILVVYKSGGNEIEHAVAVFPSDDDAQNNLIESIKRIVDSSKVTGDVVRIKNPQGEIIGLGSHFKANPEVFAYRIGKLMAVIQGPPGEVLPFFQKLP
jgi:hypothetical protein